MLTCAIVLASAAGCASPSSATTAQVLETPAAYLDMELTLEGPVTWAGGCNAAWCGGEMPCNNCYGEILLGDVEVDRARTLRLVAAEDWPYAARTAGEPTQPCFDAQCTGGLPIGCNGNDLEVHCAPALPSRIVGVQGRVREALGGELVFEVSRVELDEDAPREQVIDGIRFYE